MSYMHCPVQTINLTLHSGESYCNIEVWLCSKPKKLHSCWHSSQYCFFLSMRSNTVAVLIHLFTLKKSGKLFSLCSCRNVLRFNSNYDISSTIHVLHLPNVHTVCMHRSALVGQFLDKSRSRTCTCGTKHNHSVDHQLHAGQCECRHATSLLPEVHRLFPAWGVCVYLYDTAGIRSSSQAISKNTHVWRGKEKWLRVDR